MFYHRTFPVAQSVKNLPAIWETGFDRWGGKIPWRRAWQLTPVFLLGEFPWTEEPGRLQSMGLQRVRHDWVTKHMICFKWLLTWKSSLHYNVWHTCKRTYIHIQKHMGLYLNASKSSVTYRVNSVYFSNVSSGLWLERGWLKLDSMKVGISPHPISPIFICLSCKGFLKTPLFYEVSPPDSQYTLFTDSCICNVTYSTDWNLFVTLKSILVLLSVIYAYTGQHVSSYVQTKEHSTCSFSCSIVNVLLFSH